MSARQSIFTGMTHEQYELTRKAVAMNTGEYRTQVIYQHPKHGRVLWATRETNEALIIVECIESGRLPILHVDKYNPLSGPDFDMYDDELHAEMYAAREDRPDAELQSTSRAAELLGSVEALPVRKVEDRPATRTGLEPVFWQPHLDGWRVGQEVSVASSSGQGRYIVSAREDTRSGGTYAHCTCPSWATQRGRGHDCKHIIDVATATANGRKAGIF